MRQQALTTVVALLCVTRALPAAAQARPVEIGAGAGGAATRAGDFTGGHLSATFPLDAWWSIEPLVAVGRDGGGTTMATYGAQTRWRLDRTSHGNVETFLTFGLLGLFERETYPEYRYRRPDGTTFVEPARTETTFTPPILGVVGIGVQQRVAAHLAVRADVQAFVFLVVPGGIRAAASIVVPIGRFTRSTRSDAAR